MRAWHILPHLHEEVVTRRWGPAAAGVGLGSRRIAGWGLLAGRTVVDTKSDVEELDDGALGVATTAVLAVLAATRLIELVEDAFRQTSLGHVLAPCKERPDAVVENGRVAALVDALQQSAEVVQALCEYAQATADGRHVAIAGSGHGRQHERDNGRAPCLDGDRDQVKPGLVDGAGEGGQGGEVLERVDALVDEQRLEVPKTDAGIGGDREDLEPLRDGQERHGNGGREAVAGAVTTPDVTVRHEDQQAVSPPPFRIVFQTDGGEHREAVDDASEAPAEDQGLQVRDDGLPLVVVRVREPRQGKGFGQEAMAGRDSIVGEYRDGREHDFAWWFSVSRDPWIVERLSVLGWLALGLALGVSGRCRGGCLPVLKGFE